jgi:hypothetical protein
MLILPVDNAKMLRNRIRFFGDLHHKLLVLGSVMVKCSYALK